MDFGALINADAGGWAAFVTIVVSFVTSIARGWLVPRKTIEQLEAAARRVEEVQAQRLADSTNRETEWRASWLAEKTRGDLQADQIGDLLELARLWDPIIRNRTGGGSP
jgi:hypothetical protein